MNPLRSRDCLEWPITEAVVTKVAGQNCPHGVRCWWCALNPRPAWVWSAVKFRLANSLHMEVEAR